MGKVQAGTDPCVSDHEPLPRKGVSIPYMGKVQVLPCDMQVYNYLEEFQFPIWVRYISGIEDEMLVLMVSIPYMGKVEKSLYALTEERLLFQFPIWVR